ncbi:hypothetical protein LRQ07_05035 [Microbacterium sp. J1-1]|nr:hypothetical protein LRQ07_05035 [Microbacterium sp. J1-1]
MNKTYRSSWQEGMGESKRFCAVVVATACDGSGIGYARNRRDWRLGGLPPGSD